MFSVIFEVHPAPDQWDAYLEHARMLRPELQAIEGFVDNVRYRSLTRDGWILSLSGWRDEKSLVRWRTHAAHHGAQEQGRERILSDYHLRVGQLTADSQVPAGHAIVEQRLDETAAGAGTAVVLLDGQRSAEWVAQQGAEAIARDLGLDPAASGLGHWDCFDAVLAPGDVIVLATCKTQDVARRIADGAAARAGVRRRTVRVIRDYGMFDRREAPQYYPQAGRR